jgi:hypothetical protein
VLRLLAQKGTRSSYPLWTREQSNAPSLRLGYVVPIIHATMGVSDSSTEHPFPLRCVTVYRVGYVGCHPTTRRGLPSPSTRFPNIPRPIHRRVLRRCISKACPEPVEGFDSCLLLPSPPPRRVRLPLGSLARVHTDEAAGFT